MRQKRTYRYRFSPTPEHADVLARTCGSARYLYKWARRLRTEASCARHERLGSHQASAALTPRKQLPETAWLSDVSRGPLHQAWRHLDTAFPTVFAGRAQSPTCKQTQGRQAATGD